jgi:twitching motility protein PilT
MARLDSFLRLVAEQRGSDLHLHAGNAPVVRHDGELIALPFRVMSEQETRRFLYEVLTPSQRDQVEREQQVDFLYVLPSVGRFRASVFTQSQGLSAVFRFIPGVVPTLDDLRFPPTVKALSRLSNGLVLVTGPTGSGKTTTLAAMVHEINSTSQRHVITIEDPVEFVHQPIQGLITHREVGRDTESFAAGLRAALREAPDVVVVGELRDLETTQLALSAAETGVLVISTLHTNSAAAAVDRIIDIIPDELRDQARGLLSVVLKGVLAMHLCRRAVGEGRVAALEILLHSYGVAHMIRENKTHQIEAYLQSAPLDSGMQSLDSCLLHLVQEGLIAPEEGVRLANFPDQLGRTLSALPEER